jgi:hypothetical protein
LPGYLYRLYNPDGDEVGTFHTLAWNWKVGETFQTGDGSRYRILSIVGLDDSDDSSGKFQAAFMVEPWDAA